MNLIEKTLNKLFNEHRSCLSTFKECSIDTSKNPTCYLSSNEEPAFDFDEIKEKFCEKNHITHVSSMDSLYITLDKIYLIEFKNQKNNKLKWEKIKNKMHDSLSILNKELSIDDSNFHQIEAFIITPDRGNNSINKMLNHGKNLVNEPFECNQLEIFSEVYGLKCYKSTNKEFENYIAI